MKNFISLSRRILTNLIYSNHSYILFNFYAWKHLPKKHSISLFLKFNSFLNFSSAYSETISQVYKDNFGP